MKLAKFQEFCKVWKPLFLALLVFFACPIHSRAQQTTAIAFRHGERPWRRSSSWRNRHSHQC